MQFGHLFAKGDTREGAIRAMVVALKEVKIRGEIRTTVDYCVEMIQSPDFVGNNIHTGWLDARISSHVGPLPLHHTQQQQACQMHSCHVWGTASTPAGCTRAPPRIWAPHLCNTGSSSSSKLAECTHVMCGRLVCHCQQAYSCLASCQRQAEA